MISTPENSDISDLPIWLGKILKKKKQEQIRSQKRLEKALEMIESITDEFLSEIDEINSTYNTSFTPQEAIDYVSVNNPYLKEKGL